MTDKHADPQDLRAKVREGYGRIAQSGGGCCGPSCGCGSPAADNLATMLGYSREELSELPEQANLGLSCGNPTAMASLRPGEIVLDLGSGAGFDVFIAGRKVGPTGHVIGVDMTPAMLEKARGNIQAYRRNTGLDNIEFRLGEIEHLPVADAAVDVVVSNCVLNLSPDKPQVWREIARVLKPGGRVAISDLALLRPLPEEIGQMIEALIGCIAGAVSIEEIRRMMLSAGLVEIELTQNPAAIEAMTDWNDPLYRSIVERLGSKMAVCEMITSLHCHARKPAASPPPGKCHCC